MNPIRNTTIKFRGKRIRVLLFGPGNYHHLIKLLEKKLTPNTVEQMMGGLIKDIVGRG
jgi:hypothetical protein